MKNTLRIAIAFTFAFFSLFTLAACTQQVTIQFETNGGTALEKVKIDQGNLLPTFGETTRTGYDFAGWYLDAAFTNQVDWTALIQRNLTLYAKWNVQSYTVTFLDGEEVLSSATITYGQAIPFPENPVKTGYVFTGWKVDGTIVNSSTILTASTTVDAEFVPAILSVTFDLGDGTTVVKTLTYGEILDDIPATALTPVAGKEIVWVIVVDGTATDERPDFTALVADLEVRSVYVDVYHTVTFVDGSGTDTTVSVLYGDTVTRPADPVLEHHDFSGWNDPQGLRFDFATPVTADLTLTAVFALKRFSVSFYDGSGMLIGTPQQVSWGGSATAPNYVAPIGYVFTGWDLEFSNVTADLQVHAQVTGNTYQIVFVANGGSPTASLSAVIGSAIQPPANPAKAGYSFDGWYADEALSTEFSSWTTMPYQGLTLYAKWNANRYTLSFETHGGSAASSVIVPFGSAVSFLPVSVRTGYTLAGWNTLADGTGTAYTAQTVFDTVGDLVLHAVWTPDADTAYEVEYYLMKIDGSGYDLKESVSLKGTTDTLVNAPVPTYAGFAFESGNAASVLSGTIAADGSLVLKVHYSRNQYQVVFQGYDGSVLSTQTVYHGTAATAPTAPTLPGYTFNGWDRDFSNVTGDLVVSAKKTEYSANDYNLNFNAEGGTVYPAFLLVTFDAAVGTLPVPTRTGYDFAGWNTLADGTGTAFTAETVYSVAGDTTLHAIWTPKTDTVYTVQYYFENAETAGYTRNDALTQVLSGTTGASVTAAIPDREGFVFAAAYAGNLTEGAILADGSLVLKVYYSRLVFTVNLVDAAGIAGGTFTVKFGGKLSALPSPSGREGYQFLGWIDGDGLVYTAADTVTGTLYLYAKWEALTCTVTVERIFYRGTEEETANRFQFTRQIAYGTGFSPVSDIAGYDFAKFSYLEDATLVEVTDADGILTVTKAVTIYVYYARQSFTVSFSQLADASGTLQTDSFSVYYDENFTAIPALLLAGDPAYSLVVWSQSVFQNVRGNLAVTAVYYPASGKTVTFMDGGAIRFLAREDELGAGVFVTDTSPLWNLTRSGYLFSGWFYDPEGTLPVAISDMDFAVLTGSVTVYAVWVKLDAFAAPASVLVTKSNSVISVSWTQESLNGVFPAAFELFIDGSEWRILAADCVQTGNVFTYSGSALSALAAAGTHYVAVKAVGDGLANLSGAYSAVAQYVVATEEEEITDTEVYDYFLIEKTVSGDSVYIFYTDMTYNFSSKYAFQVLEGGKSISATGNVLKTSGIPGTFQLLLTKTVDGVSTQSIVTGKVVTYINQFQWGSNLSGYLNEIADPSYLESVIEPYKVGYRNVFRFDLKILDNTGTRIDAAETALTFTFALWDGTAFQTLTEETAQTYFTVGTGYSFQFKAAAAGKTFRVSVQPRYQALQMQVPTRTFDFTVIDAYNAFTNEQLQSLYANLNVHAIVLHADIKAAVDPDYLNEDGSPVNGQAYVRADGSLDLRGNVYQRLGTRTADVLVLEGNYFTVDGTDLPFVNPTSDPDGAFQTVGIGSGSTYGIVNVQISIFYYGVTPDPTNVSLAGDNKVTYRNLTLLGNTTTPSVNYALSADEIAYQEQLMARNSGGFVGFLNRKGSISAENVNVGYTTIAFFYTAYGTLLDGTTPVSMNVSSSRIHDSWANSFYIHGATVLDISESEIGSSGGAAIHLEDIRSGNSGIEDPHLILDAATTVDNWVSGDEAWFKAYGFSSLALGLKSQVQGGLDLLGLDQTIIQLRENEVTGAQTEKINFVLLTLGMSGATTEDANHAVISGSETVLTLTDAVGTAVLDRSFDYLGSDLRSQSFYQLAGSLTYLYAVGQYSDSTAYAILLNQAINDLSYLAGYGYTAAQIQQAAFQATYVAGFYNLPLAAAEQAVLASAQYSISISQAVATVTGGNVPVQPRFLEIGQTATGIGAVTILLGYYPKV